jgi:hypothetical protein
VEQAAQQQQQQQRSVDRKRGQEHCLCGEPEPAAGIAHSAYLLTHSLTYFFFIWSVLARTEQNRTEQNSEDQKKKN